MAWDTAFESAFNPKVVAVVGVPAKPNLNVPSGARFIVTYQQFGFKGKIYAVNPNASEILGCKAYPSLSSIPEHIDLVIITVSAKGVPAVLEDCIAADARNIHLFSAGFEETGEEEGRALGKQVREIARRGKLRILGPNCMGLYVPESRMGGLNLPPTQSGPVSFIFQSGGHGDWFQHHGPNYGIYFNKGISIGNAYVLDSTDFLEYLSDDAGTRIICMYLEGVKDGKKLFSLMRDIIRRKPIILWKGGMTAEGARAALSHTGSLSGEASVWEALFKQTNAVPVYTLEEMAETTMTFLCLKPPGGKRVGVMGMGGGISVAAADTCSRAGLEVPALRKETQDELRKFIPSAGASFRNPIDYSLGFFDIALMEREMELVAADPSIDVLILMPHLNLAHRGGPEQVDKLVNTMCDFALNNRYGKPVAFVFYSFVNDPWENEICARLRIELPQKGIAVYSSLSSAARALAKFYEYHRNQQRYSIVHGLVPHNGRARSSHAPPKKNSKW